MISGTCVHRMWFWECRLMRQSIWPRSKGGEVEKGGSREGLKMSDFTSNHDAVWRFECVQICVWMQRLVDCYLLKTPSIISSSCPHQIGRVETWYILTVRCACESQPWTLSPPLWTSIWFPSQLQWTGWRCIMGANTRWMLFALSLTIKLPWERKCPAQQDGSFSRRLTTSSSLILKPVHVLPWEE